MQQVPQKSTFGSGECERTLTFPSEVETKLRAAQKAARFNVLELRSEPFKETD